MKRVIVLGIIFILIMAGYFLFQKDLHPDNSSVYSTTKDNNVKDSQQMNIAKDAVFGYEFSYREEPDGYITLEDNDSTHPNFVSGIRLINRTAYTELEASTEAREYPPSINLHIYTNPDNLNAPIWAIKNTKETNYELMLGTTNEVIISDTKAVHFIADGLYTIDTYVITSGKHIYVLKGEYFENSDQIYHDFQALVKSFTLIPDSLPQGKIDPKVACESALVYMTFESGDASDKFVADCLEGNHPEVIDRYIKDMGLNGATI